MTDIRSELHEEIERMAEWELRGLKEFLSTYPDKLGVFLRSVPWDDEPFTEEDEKALAESDEWFRQNGGRGIPHEEVIRELGLGRYRSDDAS